MLSWFSSCVDSCLDLLALLPSLGSSLHFMGIYLLRCLIAHVTGSLQLTDTSHS